MEVLLHLVHLGALFRSQRAVVEFGERFGADRQHLAAQLPLHGGQLLQIGIALTGFDGRGKRLAVLLQLLPNRLGRLAGLLCRRTP
jgi:hypothetical protein